MKIIKSNPTFVDPQKNEWPGTLIEFELEQNESLTPDRLPEIADQLRQEIEIGDYRGPIFISGRGPIWLFLLLAHQLHPGHSVGCFDPRIGYIISESHSPDLQTGTILEAVKETA